jgi:hypothetical protein
MGGHGVRLTKDVERDQYLGEYDGEPIAEDYDVTEVSVAYPDAVQTLTIE